MGNASVTVRLQKCNDQTAEVIRLFHVRQVSGVFDDEAARVGDAILDDACMRVYIADVVVADEYQSGDAYFAEARHGRARGGLAMSS
jgi:hypothetical protein